MLILTFSFIVILLLSNYIFDKIWIRSNSFPLTNLEDVYKIPQQYNNINAINLKMIDVNKIGIEGNKKFKASNNNKNYEYYDTVIFNYPDKVHDITNTIYLQFENNNNIDSIIFVVSKSNAKELFWKQIFLSSVLVTYLNEFSDDTAGYRIKPGNLVEPALLANNDTLINSAINYFNSKKDSLYLPECGTTCEVFLSICKKLNLPGRIISLQGGDAFLTGLHFDLGYPIHVICEIYSSKNKKWYVIDPTYGLRFKRKNSDEFMNSVEISNKTFFIHENEISQDSVLFTKRSVLKRDYFKFYENVFFESNFTRPHLFIDFLKIFYGKFNYMFLHYSNNQRSVKNSYYYLAIKSLLYIIISLIYFNLILFLLTRRLFKVKKPVLNSHIKK